MNITVLADELTAVGWRIAGARVVIPDQKSARDAFQSALADADVVLLTREVATALPATLLEDALFSESPLVLVIGGAGTDDEPNEIEIETRRALGVSE